jgi:hypothetical protein
MAGLGQESGQTLRYYCVVQSKYMCACNLCGGVRNLWSGVLREYSPTQISFAASQKGGGSLSKSAVLLAQREALFVDQQKQQALLGGMNRGSVVKGRKGARHKGLRARVAPLLGRPLTNSLHTGAGQARRRQDSLRWCL